MPRLVLIALILLLAAVIASAAPPDADDGAATITPDRPFIAGSTDQFAVEYKAGPKGIPVGGGAGVSFLHAIRIDLSTNPSAQGYVSVTRSSGSSLSTRLVGEFVPNLLEYRPDPSGASRITRVTILTKVVQRAVQPGELIRFVFGANDKKLRIPPNVCEDPFNVVIDLDGDGTYSPLQNRPHFRIVGGPLDHLFITVPATRAVGEKADICIRGEDALDGPSPGCSAEVTLRGMPGIDGTRVKLKDGIGRIEVPVSESGVFRITASAGRLTTRSNPMVVTQKPPEFNVYWGDMHAHTVVSDGCGGDADYLYSYARDAADLDVCASADHAPREQSRLATKKYNQPGRFVTIWGYEWAESKPGRMDRNIYFRDEDDPLPQGWPATIEDFWKSLQAAYGDNSDRRVIVGPHMFTYKTAARPWFETWDPRYDRFVEIYSEHGMSEYQGNPRMLAHGGVQPGYFAQDGLKYGRKFGIIGSSDTHDTRPGRGSNSLSNRGGLVAFLAKDLTRESIWDAWWNRRVYAATNERIYIDFKIDGHLMGQEFTAVSKPRISYTVYGCDETFDVYLIRNNSEIRKSHTTNGTITEAFTDFALNTDSYYYLRVAQADGEWAWSSPIWVNVK